MTISANVTVRTIKVKLLSGINELLSTVVLLSMAHLEEPVRDSKRRNEDYVNPGTAFILKNISRQAQ